MPKYDYALDRSESHPFALTPYKIERNVPLPQRKAHANTKYPFPLMEVKDSFLVHDIKERQIVRAAAYEYGRKYNMKFATRTVGDATRVWRLS